MPKRQPIRLTPTLIEFFHSMVAQTDDPDECWEWQHELGAGGYGRLCRTWATHRIAYFLHYGRDPGVENVLHKCNNPPCCNPHHLYLGTQKQNLEQCVREGRNGFGVGPGLSPDQVREIRDNPKVPLKVYAKRFGRSVATIHRARTRKYYKGIE